MADEKINKSSFICPSEMLSLIIDIFENLIIFFIYVKQLKNMFLYVNLNISMCIKINMFKRCQNSVKQDL